MEVPLTVKQIEYPNFPNQLFRRLPSLYSLLKEYGPDSSHSFIYQHPYHEAFDRDLLISENLAHTLKEHLPVFHPNQKRADQQLVLLKEGRLQVILLSIFDAAFFKIYLEVKQPDNMWLIHPNGREISSHPHRPLSAEEAKKLERFLLQIALFNGDASYLYAHGAAFSSWLKESARDIKLQFLGLKVLNDPIQKEIFFRHLAL